MYNFCMINMFTQKFIYQNKRTIATKLSNNKTIKLPTFLTLIVQSLYLDSGIIANFGNI